MLKMIQRFLHWIGLLRQLFNYVLLMSCNKVKYDGFTLYVTEDAKDAENYYKIVKNALNKIKEIDARKYKRVKKYLRSIAYVEMGSNCYMQMQRSFFVDTIPEDKDYFASSIIHEATHGYLFSKGFLYSKDMQEQHERICTKEQLYFLTKLIAKKENLSKEEQMKEVLRYKKYFEKSLQRQWWDKKVQKEKRINRLKILLKREFDYKTHSVNGYLEFEVKMIDGKKNGVYKYYYEDGKLKEEGTYVNDARQGVVKHYYSSGSLKSESNIVNDVYDGKCKEYFESGILKHDGSYRDDKQDGFFKFYDESGKLKSESNYKSGKQDGISRWYNSDGSVKTEAKYIHGKKVKDNSEEKER